MNPLPLFSAQSKMADLVLANGRLLYVLPYFEIELGFGEKTVRQVCADRGVSVELLLVVCNLYTFDDYVPPRELLEQIPLQDIVRYLQHSHRDYLQVRLPGLIAAVLSLALEGGDAMLASFCEKYRQEVVDHFRYEEEVVFPYIHQLVQGQNPDYRISEYQTNHSDIDAALEDLKSLLVKFLSKDCLPGQYRPVLMELFMFEYDLRKHTQLEDTILIPRALDFSRPAGFSEFSQLSELPERSESSFLSFLSERERQTLSFLARGFSNKEIAARLHISIHTVISHRKNIMRKTGIKTVQGLTLYALQGGLLSPDDLRG